MSEKEDNITPLDREYLARVANGEFDHLVAVPQEVRRLISLGLVRPVATLSFPIIPTQYEYRLTLYGLKVLNE